MAKDSSSPAPAGRHIDQATGVETVGHEWDGIQELNNPLPRWWVWTFYLTILFAIGYVAVYPELPLIDKGTQGLWGWTSRGQLAAETSAAEARHGPLIAALAQVPTERLAGDPELMRSAIAGGKAAFKVNCVQCHGSGAAGSAAGGAGGYPNLNDDDWLWGGDIKAIEYSITHGIRQPSVDGQKRFSQMPAFGRDGLLSPAEIQALVSHVRTLSGKEQPGGAAVRGGELFAANCASCHGPDGKGLRQFGAPNLTDAIWLRGGSRAEITASISNAPAGVMPAWGSRLDPVTIKMLAAYVHSLGGGEDFAAAPIAAAPVAGAALTPAGTGQ
jgi:cytochrome c oxidase cbb3-type subunit 3